MEYIQNNSQETKEMLEAAGAQSCEAFFENIPKELRAKELNVSGGHTEQELLKIFKESAAKNKTLTVFRGAGIYDHYIPSLVGEIISRSEFWTA
ncbi:MAG: hypothetical protein LBU09_04895, partial [Endomicrobium sp.]|nr:hypothetical protein [Endomicrobium sp.]